MKLYVRYALPPPPFQDFYDFEKQSYFLVVARHTPTPPPKKNSQKGDATCLICVIKKKWAPPLTDSNGGDGQRRCSEKTSSQLQKQHCHETQQKIRRQRGRSGTSWKRTVETFNKRNIQSAVQKVCCSSTHHRV